MKVQNHQGAARPLSTSRLEAFSDGVFAVAITLLVLNIQVPHNVSASELPHEVFTLWPRLLVYAQSFVIVGIYWVAHHNSFHYIKWSNRTLLWLNIFLLLCIVFIPFPTALLGEYPEQQISVIVYSSTLVITGLVLQLLWWYVTSGFRLVDPKIDPRLVQRATRRNVMAPLIYLVAIGVSFLSVQASWVVIALVPILYIFPGRIDRHWQRRTVSTIDAAVATDTDVDSEE